MKALQMCLDWAAIDKAHAWELAKQLAKLDPFQLGDIPEKLTAEMLKRK